MQNAPNIVLTGVESTGKSELALLLAQHLRRPLVAECARQYLQYIGTNYAPHDVENIARLQTDAIRHTAQHSPIVADTDALVCKIWYEHKYQRPSALINYLFQQSQQQNTLYVLPHLDDCPYTPDPLRETPDPSERLHLFRLYLQALTNARCRFVIPRGNPIERLRQVLRE